MGPRYTYALLASVTKPPGAGGRAYYQGFTVPPHTGRDCLLVAYRDGVQQPYRGWTADPPFGWHRFGIEEPLYALVVEFPPGALARDMRNYESNKRNQWAHPAFP
jgi:hypothetical protein